MTFSLSWQQKLEDDKTHTQLKRRWADEVKKAEKLAASVKKSRNKTGGGPGDAILDPISALVTVCKLNMNYKWKLNDRNIFRFWTW